MTPLPPLAHESKLLEALASVDSPADMRAFLRDILTPSEYRLLCRRWSILTLLRQGRTQRAVVAALGASLCNVTRGARILRSPAPVTDRILQRAVPDAPTPPPPRRPRRRAP
jgi:TrpR family trp operon transcriptional repressor